MVSMSPSKQKIEESLEKLSIPNPEQRRLTTVQLENGETYTESWNRNFEKLSEDIEKFYEENRMRKEDFAERMFIVEEIKEHLDENIFSSPINGVYFILRAIVPFGNGMNGLGMKTDGLNLTICVIPINVDIESMTRVRNEDILAKIIEEINSGQMMEHRKWSEIDLKEEENNSILIGKVDDVELKLRISMTDKMSSNCISTPTIELYKKYDDRFLKLAAYISAWEKARGVGTNLLRDVFPNGSTTVLMVMVFMKYYHLLPDKDTLKTQFITETEIQRWKSENESDVSLGTLFFLYINFYSNVVRSKETKSDENVAETSGDIVMAEEDAQNYPTSSTNWIQEHEDSAIDAENTIGMEDLPSTCAELFRHGLPPDMKFYAGAFLQEDYGRLNTDGRGNGEPAEKRRKIR
uniref:PAP-associated domain-containing protein n=1 Tax=Caenorhabditis tropicalis TaxID=1561998 RepID=A0A1I7TU31_9PELO